jgi:lipopolysaccharide heptosyltransferase II
LAGLKEELKSRNYDLILDLQNNLRSKKITSRITTKKLKFDKKDFDKFLLVNFKINRLRKTPPVPERYASVFDEFQLDNKGLDLLTNKPSSDLLRQNKKYIGLCPGSRHFTKMWPKEYYVKLGNLLAKDNYKIVLLGGSDDKKICSEISSQIPDSINLSNNDEILQTAANMKRCSAIICNDSGLMHAACAEQIPVMAFFGSTVKEFGFVPYKNKNIILENNSLSCRPCTHIGKSYCPKGHFKCMIEITPNTAFDKLKLLLNSE